jgi:hypothetical protein
LTSGSIVSSWLCRLTSTLVGTKADMILSVTIQQYLD